MDILAPLRWEANRVTSRYGGNLNQVMISNFIFILINIYSNSPQLKREIIFRHPIFDGPNAWITILEWSDWREDGPGKAMLSRDKGKYHSQGN
jgi:hypothetical protein